MKPVSARGLTVGYLVALGIIALLTIAAHLTLNRVLAEHEGSAAIVNVSGRQRMLSQRIASLSAQYELGVPGVRDDLMAAISQFESAHHKLLADSTSRTASGERADPFRDMYFGGTAPLDGEVAAFIDLARQIASRPPQAPESRAPLAALFAEARQPLLTKLNEVVQRHQRDSEEQLGRLESLQRVTLAVVLLTLAAEALVIFRPMVRRITRYARDLVYLASIDGLTGTLNRQSFMERAEAETRRALRLGAPVAVLMLDADHFKQINDCFGHEGGDAALRALAHTLRRGARGQDVIGRLGGEEFAILMPATGVEEAASLAERLRAEVAQLSVSSREGAISLTVSVGVAGRTADCDMALLLHEADKALYRAKREGRDRVVTALAPSARLLA